MRAGDVKTTHHRQVVGGECMGHQAGTNKLLTFSVQHPVYDVPTAVDCLVSGDGSRKKKAT